MGIVYMVPGLAATSLGTSLLTTDDTWCNYTTLAQGFVGRLRLAGDGVSPGPPDGVQLYPGGLFAAYYDAALNRLNADLSPRGYTVRAWPYDWRLSCRTTGAALAAAIRSTSSPATPATIIGHSLGGLVARVAWSELLGTGDTALVRRIITLGTPHWGSYGIVRNWCNDNVLNTQIAALSSASTVLVAGLLPAALGRIWDGTRIAALVASWPSAYETLPSLLDPAASADPNRNRIYTGPWPSALAISPNFLAYAQAIWQPLMAGASSIPPSGVLTTVAGRGFPTACVLDNPQALGTAQAYAFNTAGDNQVETISALLPSGATVSVVAAHADLPNATAGSGLLTSLVLDPRTGDGPPPAPIVANGLVTAALSGPPVTTVLGGRGILAPRMLGGDC